MARFYSQSTGCTYLPEIHGKNMPADVVQISDAIYLAVIASPAPGQVRSHAADGTPLLVDAPARSKPSHASVENQRLRAYADPLTGSDRHFSEANRESLLGNTDAAEQARLRGLERFTEIQRENPWPDVPEQTQ